MYRLFHLQGSEIHREGQAGGEELEEQSRQGDRGERYCPVQDRREKTTHCYQKTKP